MRLAVPRESASGERRVALVPEVAARLVTSGYDVVVETKAGVEAGFPDDAYTNIGARIASSPAELLEGAGIVLRIQPPTDEEVRALPRGATLISFLNPLTSPALVSQLAQGGVTSFAMELVPRITRAQKMDALSSQATVAGYKAVLLASSLSPRFFPMLTTAAGTVAPAKVLVIGAGVAGLMAIATARRLGAMVEGFDIRAASQEQVESLGAKWVGFVIEAAQGAGGYAKEISEEDKQREHEHLARIVASADVVITTAQVPGRRAPLLLTEDMLRGMKPGSVVVDLAADSGGNSAWTQAGRDVVRDGITVSGPSNLPATLPLHASQMYSRNIAALVAHLVQDVLAQHRRARRASRAGRRAEDRSRGRDHRRLLRHARRRGRTPDAARAESRSGINESRGLHPVAPDLRVRSRRFRRIPGHLESSSAAAHTADVGDERDLGHLARRFAGRGRLRARRDEHGARRDRGVLRRDQRGGRIRHHGSHAAHVPRPR
jgi:H+-translocating NAD(P) transhydrogenase subunit alpha